MDGYLTQSPDTSRAAEEFLFNAYRRMKPAEKIRIIGDLNRTMDEIARIAIRKQHPNATKREVALRLAARKYGRELMVKAFGWDPDVEGQ